MSKHSVQSFMLGYNVAKNFAGSNVRPQTIGEEGDIISIHERSTHSSISEISKVSAAALGCADFHLAYEPDRSASPLPPYDQRKHSMHSLLNDRDGILAFKHFLSEINEVSILECWLAMKGFRDFDLPQSGVKSPAASPTHGSHNQPSKEKSAKKTYLQSSSKSTITFVKDATTQRILKQIKVAFENPATIELDSRLFLEAQSEIEHNIEATLYERFLASDEFLNLSTQQDGSSPKTPPSLSQNANLSQSPKKTEANKPSESELPIAVPQISYLPRLDENQVCSPTQKKQESLTASGSASRKSHYSDSLSSTSMSRPSTSSAYSSVARNHQIIDPFQYFIEGASAYRAPPPSAIGSDQASKSSGTTTKTPSIIIDNTNVDGADANTLCRQGQKDLVQDHAIIINSTNGLPVPETFDVPRPSWIKEKLKKKLKEMELNNLARKNPPAYFNLLEKSLLKVVEERRIEEIEDEAMDKMLESHVSRFIKSPKVCHSPPRGYPSHTRMLQPPTAGIPVSHAGTSVLPKVAQNEVPIIATPIEKQRARQNSGFRSIIKQPWPRFHRL